MYQKPFHKKRLGKKPLILLISLVMLLGIALGGTVAFLVDNTREVTNTFTPGRVTVEIAEETTATQKSNIKFQNTGNVDAYIRATLAIYWKDSAGNIVAPPAGGKVELGTLRTGWKAQDDIYYYAPKVTPNGWTGVMMTPITVTCPEGYQCIIDVHAEAIQADGDTDDTSIPAYQEAWEMAANS